MDGWFHLEVESDFDLWLGKRYSQWDTVGLGTLTAVCLSASQKIWNLGKPQNGAFMFITSLLCLFLLGLKLMHPYTFYRCRQRLFLALYVICHVHIAINHTFLENQARKGAPPDRMFKAMLLSKWVFAVFAYVALRLRNTSNALTMYFLSAVAVALGACTAYDPSSMDTNPYVLSLTRAVNAASFPSESASLTAGTLAHNAQHGVSSAMTPRQCIVAMWLMLQGAALWANILISVGIEAHERQRFVLEHPHLAMGPCPESIWGLLGCLFVYYAYICWLIVWHLKGMGLSELGWLL